MPPKKFFWRRFGASLPGYEGRRHIVNGAGGTTVALSTQAYRARGRGVTRRLWHDSHRDLTDAMRPEIFHQRGHPDRLGTALQRTESRATELTYELLRLRGSVLSDGRNRPRETISNECWHARCRGITGHDPDEDDDPGGGQ